MSDWFNFGGMRSRAGICWIIIADEHAFGVGNSHIIEDATGKKTLKDVPFLRETLLVSRSRLFFEICIVHRIQS